jgi:2-polyprenyl-3-methyl-5-hydroxy-6-metoxy-1,4-benzoquinol methylase
MLDKNTNYLSAATEMIREKKFRLLVRKVKKVLKLCVYNLIYLLRNKKIADGKLEVLTGSPIALSSPDHLMPTGTKSDNSTNKLFVIKMDRILKSKFSEEVLGILDLGCAGGAMINDFRNLGYHAVGLEGSDYSLINKRAHWPKLAHKNLFTCDITKDYEILVNGRPYLFSCITAWEVMEHINKNDLLNTFELLKKHLRPGGYFIFSTTNTSDMRNGIELHQTQMNTDEWIEWVTKNIPGLNIYDLGFEEEEYVRQGTNKTLVFTSVR